MSSQPLTSTLIAARGKRSRAHSVAIPDKRTRVADATSGTDQQPSTSTPTDADRTNNIVQAIDAVIAAGRSTAPMSTPVGAKTKSSEVCALRQEVSALQAVVQRHESTIAALEQRVCDLLSAFGLVSSAASPSMSSSSAQSGPMAGDGGSAVAAVAQPSSSSSLPPPPRPSYSRAAVAAAPAVRAIRESVVAAVYVDKAASDRRSSSFIVSGLPPSPSADDKKLVADLCHRDLGVRPDITAIKRLGHPRPSAPQPLLVHVKQSDEAQHIIRHARSLRQSSDNFTQLNVFINANLTKAEAKAAYDIRCRRRQSNATHNAAAAPSPAINSQVQVAPPQGSPALNPAATAFNPTV